MIHETSEEVFEQFGLKIADQARLDAILIDQRGTAAEMRDNRRVVEAYLGALLE